MAKDRQYREHLVRHFGERSEFWKDVYESPDQSDVFYFMEVTRRKKVVTDYLDGLPPFRKLRILDLGSGAGGVAGDLLRRGHEVVCLDISLDMLRAARKLKGEHGARVKMVGAEVESLPLRSGLFDVVVCMGLFQFLENDDPPLREIGRVMKDDGVVFISLPNIIRFGNLLDPYYYLVRAGQFLAAKARRANRAGAGTYDVGGNRDFRNRRYYFNQMGKVFGRNRFRVRRCHPLGFGPLTFWRKRVYPERISMKLDGLFQGRVERNPVGVLRIVANQWVVELAKCGDAR